MAKNNKIKNGEPFYGCQCVRCGGDGRWSVFPYGMKQITCDKCGRKTYRARNEDIVATAWEHGNFMRFDPEDNDRVLTTKESGNEEKAETVKTKLYIEKVVPSKNNGEYKYPAAVKLLEDALKEKVEELQSLAKELDEIKGL